MELNGLSFLGIGAAPATAQHFKPRTHKAAHTLPPPTTRRHPQEIESSRHAGRPRHSRATRRPPAKPRPRFCAAPRTGSTLTSRNWPSARISKQHCRCRGCWAKWAALRASAPVCRLVEEGSWVQARIDPALPDRQPLPRPDLRSMLRPLGPVVGVRRKQLSAGLLCCRRRYGVGARGRMPGDGQGSPRASRNQRNRRARSSLRPFPPRDCIRACLPCFTTRASTSDGAGQASADQGRRIYRIACAPGAR